ncbi:hypothetical protein GCM10022287_12390 [Gryllotalpicola koreensis]|uniref:Uncharacterized protein n=1 Tax=Gryllotalpicola koreensis TaxID=993086 RepID=A0ABP7ZWD9_9MICO
MQRGDRPGGADHDRHTLARRKPPPLRQKLAETGSRGLIEHELPPFPEHRHIEDARQVLGFRGDERGGARGPSIRHADHLRHLAGRADPLDPANVDNSAAVRPVLGENAR